MVARWSSDPAARAESDKKTMPDQIAQEQAQDGAYNIKLGEALYGYGMYPQAEAAARAGDSKRRQSRSFGSTDGTGPGVNAEGKYDDAVVAFGQVSGGGPVTPRIARLWADYARIKKRG